jgi:hypothetical protein
MWGRARDYLRKKETGKSRIGGAFMFGKALGVSLVDVYILHLPHTCSCKNLTFTLTVTG